MRPYGSRKIGVSSAALGLGLAGLAVALSMLAPQGAPANRASAFVAIEEAGAPALLDDGDPDSLRQAIPPSWCPRPMIRQGTAPITALTAQEHCTERRALDTSD